MKKQKLSFPTLLQAGCSAILFISCLLPWLNITSPQEFLRGEFSLINMPVQTVSDTGIMTNTFPPVGSIFDYYRIVLYVILFFIFINIFIQLIKKIPLFTCYSCLLPTCFSYLFWARVADCGNYLECAGIGLYLTNIFGTIAIAAAWTDLGRNYEIHRKLFSFCWKWSMLCFVLPIILIPLSGIYYSLLHYLGNRNHANTIFNICKNRKSNIKTKKSSSETLLIKKSLNHSLCITIELTPHGNSIYTPR